MDRAHQDRGLAGNISTKPLYGQPRIPLAAVVGQHIRVAACADSPLHQLHRLSSAITLPRSGIQLGPLLLDTDSGSV